MAAAAIDSAQRRQLLTIMIVGAVVFLATAAFDWMAMRRFADVEAAWEEHNRRATAIGDALSSLNRHIGYGGFIHNFKDLVLRRDVKRYEASIERDLFSLSADIEKLDKLLGVAEDRAALGLVRATFNEYAEKYYLVAPMIALGKTREEIDAVVKVSDEAALAAMARLSSRAAERARDAEANARRKQDEAIQFQRVGGILTLLTLLAATVTTVVFLRRVVEAHAAMRRTRRQLDTLLDTSPDPMLTVAPDGRIVRANQMAVAFFGYPNAELLAMQVEQLIPERFRAHHVGQREGYFADPRHRPMGVSTQLTALTRDGREPHVEISLSYSGEGAERLATITVRDVTERERNRHLLEEAHGRAAAALAREREIQDELVRVEKMVALGGLVAGVAHEINTPVGVALSSATHLEEETRKTDTAYRAGELTEEGLNEYFDTAKQAARLMTLNAQRASDLIQSFKQVAVDQTGGERRRFDLAHYLDEVMLSLRPRLRKTRVELDILCPEGIEIDGLPGALSQVITNLVVNSLTHAFAPDASGRIVIAAEQDANDWIELVYADDGCGIPVELHDKVFEPFFTTKRSAGGSGLGLHIVHNIAYRTLQGSLDLDSAPGDGTRFTLRFPRRLQN